MYASSGGMTSLLFDVGSEHLVEGDEVLAQPFVDIGAESASPISLDALEPPTDHRHRSRPR